MIKTILSKVFGKKKAVEEKPNESIVVKFNQQSSKIIDFVEEKVKQSREEYFAIKEKIKDLHNTNYELGLKHLENGRLKDASFRFYLMRKFWPNDPDVYFQHAYCLILRNKNKAAKKVLEELLQKDPNYDARAYELLEHIKQVEKDV